MQVTHVVSPATPHPKAADPQKVHDAAQQFESLLIGQLLKGVRGSGTSWLGTGADSASESAVEMAEQELARSLSSHGGLGLAHFVEAGLNAGQQRPSQKLNE